MKKYIISLVLLMVATSSQAVVTFEFEGMFGDVDSKLSDAFKVGDKFYGSYSFDENTKPSSEFPVLVLEDSVTRMDFDSSNYVASANNGNIIYDVEDYPYFEANSIGESIQALDVNGNKLERMAFSWDNPNDVFDIDEMPYKFLPDNAYFSLAFHNEDGYLDVLGSVTSATVAQTPIPGAVWLMGSGLVGLLGLKRSKAV